jgi:ATP-binding cassette subfamily G (WHITE) protein 2 (PDR)
VKLVTARQFTELFRNKAALKAMFSSQIILGLMLGSLFWQLGGAQADARTRFGLLFFCLSFTSSVSSQLIPGFLSMRPIYYVQERGGYYHGIAYHFGRLGVTVPVAALETFCFSLIMYSMSGLQGDVFVSGHYWFFWLSLYAMNLTAKGFSSTIAALSGTPQAAMGLAPIFFVLFTMVSYIHIPPTFLIICPSFQ